MNHPLPHAPNIPQVPTTPNDPVAPDDPNRQPGRPRGPEPIDPTTTAPPIELPPSPEQEQTRKGE